MSEQMTRWAETLKKILKAAIVQAHGSMPDEETIKRKSKIVDAGSIITYYWDGKVIAQERWDTDPPKILYGVRDDYERTAD